MKMFSKKKNSGSTIGTQNVGAIVVKNRKKQYMIAGAITLFVGGGILGYAISYTFPHISNDKVEQRFTAMVTTEHNTDALNRLYKKLYEVNGTNDIVKGPVSREDRLRMLQANYDETKENIDSGKDKSVIAIINVATIAGELGKTSERDKYLSMAEARLGELDAFSQQQAKKYIQQAREVKPI